MSEQCVCKHPVVVGEGEQEHCDRCGAWTAAAFEANYQRKLAEKRRSSPVSESDPNG